MPTPGLDLAFPTVDDNKVTADLERIKAWSLRVQIAAEAFCIYRSAAYNFATAALTKMPFDAEDFDVSGRADITTNQGRYTPQREGVYRLSALLTLNVNLAAAQYFQMLLYKNGAVIREFDTRDTYTVASPRVTGSALVTANGTTDYFEVYYYNSDIARAAQVGVTNCRFEGEWLGTTT